VEYRAACGRGIGMCGYTAVPEDGFSAKIDFDKESIKEIAFDIEIICRYMYY